MTCHLHESRGAVKVGGVSVISCHNSARWSMPPSQSTRRGHAATWLRHPSTPPRPPPCPWLIPGPWISSRTVGDDEITCLLGRDLSWWGFGVRANAGVRGARRAQRELPYICSLLRRPTPPRPLTQANGIVRLGHSIAEKITTCERNHLPRSRVA